MLKKIIFISMILLININCNIHAEVTMKTFKSKICSRGNLCFAVKNDGTLWTWGTNDFFSDEELTPVKILDDVNHVDYNSVIKNDDTLWIWGMNYFETDKTDPSGFAYFEFPVKVMEDVKYVTTGDSATFVVKEDDSLWCAGTNSGWKLGFKENWLDISPAVKVMNNVKKAVSGNYHSIILKTDGTVWTMGRNYYAQLGNGGTENSYRRCKVLEDAIDIHAGVCSSFAITEDNTLWRWGQNSNFVDKTSYELVPIKYLEDVKQIAPQNGFNVILKTDGSLWMYGDNKAEDTYYLEATGQTAHMLKIKLPQKIAEDVTCINTGYCDYGQRSVFLKNTGELYQVDIVENTPYEGEFQLTKIDLDNVSPSVFDEIKTSKEYNDINEQSEVVQKAINTLAKVQIIEGVTDTEFMPDKAITRAETTAFLLRMTGKKNESGDVRFADVTTDKWYYNTVGASVKYGIVDGFDDNTFRGEETVSKLQLVCFASRALRKEGTAQETDKTYTVSSDNIPEWAKTDVEYAVINGIITEDEVKTLSEKEMTRGEAAVILYRLYHVI